MASCILREASVSEGIVRSQGAQITILQGSGTPVIPQRGQIRFLKLTCLVGTLMAFGEGVTVQLSLARVSNVHAIG